MMLYKHPYRNLFLLYGVITTLIFVLCIVLPLFNETGTLTYMDGSVGTIDHGGLWDSLDPLSKFLYSIGDYTCHQRMGRSILINGNQMPVCIREFFIFAGMAAGFFAVAFLEISGTWRRFVIALFLILLTLVEWLLEFFLGLNVPYVRAMTSILTGLAIAMLLSSVLDIERKILDKKELEKSKDDR